MYLHGRQKLHGFAVCLSHATWAGPGYKVCLHTNLLLLSFLFDRFRWPMEHAAMLFPVVHWGQQCPEHHIARMHLEGNQWVIDSFVKAKACNHSPQVAASSDKSRDYCKLLLVHERHNAIASIDSRMSPKKQNQSC
eukprot:Skav225356  [mRNA]  locus=scaffold652:34150:37293:- [translate_table: standard]